MVDHDRWYYRIVRDSRCTDLKKKRGIDEVTPYVDVDYLFELQNRQQNKCWYCATNMNWMERRTCKEGLTLERKDNTKPHYKSNCVLCCKSCNSKRYDTNTGLMKRYFSKWKNAALDVHVLVDGQRRSSFVM